uniref:Uncharacterized protein n=1 Tax=Sphaerodactylus townsendi TaxID=933632 RepID=A0ACB8ED79_9SAUR
MSPWDLSAWASHCPRASATLKLWEIPAWRLALEKIAGFHAPSACGCSPASAAQLEASRELRTSCCTQPAGAALATCLAQAELPQAWFGPSAVSLGHRKVADGLDLAGDAQQVELYYTLHAPDGMGDCGSEQGEFAGGVSAGARAEALAAPAPYAW